MNRDKIIEAMARAMDTPSGQEYMPVMRQFAERALTALHAEGLAVVPGWQPIESAPKNHLPVLVWSLEEGRTVAFQDVTWTWWPCPASYPLEHRPSYWMPLPAPPTNSTKEGSDE